VIANRFRSLVDHPLLAMRDAGLLVTINTDDPAMMDLDLGEEYRRVAEAYTLGAEQLGLFALEGIDSTWLDESDRRALRKEFEGDLARLRADEPA